MGERLFLHLAGDPSYAPGSTVPVGTTVEHRVWDELADHVAQISVYREKVSELVHERIVPDGAVRLMFDLGPRLGSADLAGPFAQAALVPLEGAVANLTVTLQPGAAAEVLGLPIRLLRDQCVSLDDLWPRDARTFAQQVADAPSDALRVAIVQHALSERLLRSKRSDRSRVCRAIRKLATDASISDVAESLGVGERRLEQLFAVEVGIAPRELRRMIRVHACIRALRRPRVRNWAELALELGFYDQAHLANDFKSVVGLTPSEFASRTSGSSKTASGRARTFGS